ncbi:protein-disulfide reductase DsbD [Wielerella bovis]|uniref:protein-disulfide reductase DsbD n=1 Tax=Wielerella bovis TaxID=2917790 RepID=UPI0020185FDE|nr:protein-disulfide reductase DsbD [Wielerella bovis]MCG7657697.1 protein-disulfide reductase DsbD [Wielerella bovis]MCG7659918.1 protein-disulfide reductase DsbD [Wielerella bovis]
MKKWLYTLLACFSFATVAHAAVNPEDLLPPEQAFVPTVTVSDTGVDVQFKIADGYYLYQSQITADTQPETNILAASATFSVGEPKEDEFFGKQIVYHHAANVKWAYVNPAPKPYTLNLHYQGCAEVGVCYPPVDTTFEITGAGVYQTEVAANNAKDLFIKKPQGNVRADTNAQNVPSSSAAANSGSLKTLSRDDFWTNLFWFFTGGLALSFTACMYPLLPIVSSIIVGDKSGSKKRAFALSLVYVQGLAVTYTSVGVLAGLTGALLTVWLQQAWVVLTAAALMVVLALSMFGLFNIQLPNAVQSYFQNQSNKLSGGKIASVFVMGMLSALIVGPCVAPPLAAALAYIGKTGDALFGGTMLYALAIGTGVPLILIGTFGGHILPRAGNWMNGIKYAFGVILLAVAVYLATPFLPYGVTAALYTLLLIAPAIYWLTRISKLSGSLKTISGILATILLLSGTWFGIQSFNGGTTPMHNFLTLHKPMESAAYGQKFTSVTELRNAIQAAHQQNPNQPVLLDFYADWCVSCKEMEVKTFGDARVQAAVPMARLMQIDVTQMSDEHKALLKEYGLFGPPGLFVLKADGSRSDALLGYAPVDEFIAWYNARK